MRIIRPMPFMGRYGSFLLLGLLVQCSDRGPGQDTKSTTSKDQDSKPEKVVSVQTAREAANLHLGWLAGSDLKNLDRVFFRFMLEKPRKRGKASAKGSAWLSREGKARFSLRRGDDAIQLSFVGKDVVLRGPAKGPFAPAEEKEAQRMQELTVLLQTLLGWDLLDPKVRLSLNKDGLLRSQALDSKNRPGRIVERHIGAKGRLRAMILNGTAHALEGERTGRHGSLPQRIQLPLADQVLNLEVWLTKADFKPGYLDPKRQSKQSTDLVIGEEQENTKPTLREFGPVWEVAIKDPLDWESRVMILTRDIIKPFSDAGLGPTGLPSLTNNGKLLLHLRRVDGKAGEPTAPKGYRLVRRRSRVSAVVYVTCTWAEAEKSLLIKLEPYIQMLGLRSRGPLWMSPYIDWASAQEGPGKKEKIKIRGEIRVR